MAKEPLVIKRLKKLAGLGGSSCIDCFVNEDRTYYSIWDSSSRTHTFPNTYQEVLTDLANRIIQHDRGLRKWYPVQASNKLSEGANNE